MSSIKPPDGRVPGAGSAAEPGPAAPAAAGVRGAAESFEDALAGAQRAGAAAAGGAVQQTAGAQALDPIAALAQAVRGGTLSPEQAIDQLVDRVADGMRKQLSEPQRNEL